ncbi:DUF1707 SHOCT-like domain-containing protein [Chondrinema litorale]|uniref:DUF1707 SHOCT-like domain-containing protein n=1 Tax=Chondrinema litorale TaxID=2994555 RepID=UPI002543D8B3|nr:LiaF domain-containing protein [Chondrinema litorale]UZR92418.1 LiaF-related protein [Chondrinema litorale]
MDRPSSRNADNNHQRPMVFGLPKYRERVITAISEAYTNNDLDIDEYERRLDIAHDARTIEELRNSVYDFPQINSLLPVVKGAQPSQGQEPKNYPPYRSAPYNSSPAENIRKTFEEIDFINIIGDKKLYSAEISKPNIKVVTGIGDTLIDLRDIAHKFTHIRIESICIIGNVRIRLPHNAKVKRNVTVVIGSTKQKQIGGSLLKKFFGINATKGDRYDYNQPEVFVEITGFKLIGDMILEFMPPPEAVDY